MTIPFIDTEGARPEIWSYGHRNQQGAALNPWSGGLWTTGKLLRVGLDAR